MIKKNMDINYYKIYEQNKKKKTCTATHYSFIYTLVQIGQNEKHVSVGLQKIILWQSFESCKTHKPIKYP